MPFTSFTSAVFVWVCLCSCVLVRVCVCLYGCACMFVCGCVYSDSVSLHFDAADMFYVFFFLLLYMAVMCILVGFFHSEKTKRKRARD